MLWSNFVKFFSEFFCPYSKVRLPVVSSRVYTILDRFCCQGYDDLIKWAGQLFFAFLPCCSPGSGRTRLACVQSLFRTPGDLQHVPRPLLDSWCCCLWHLSAFPKAGLPGVLPWRLCSDVGWPPGEPRGGDFLGRWSISVCPSYFLQELDRPPPPPKQLQPPALSWVSVFSSLLPSPALWPPCLSLPWFSSAKRTENRAYSHRFNVHECLEAPWEFSGATD